MSSIHVHNFIGWQGTLLMPTAKGSRVSRITTSAFSETEAKGWLLVTQYAALVSASAGWKLVAPGDTVINGVRVANLEALTVKKVRNRQGTVLVSVVWELVI